MRSKSQNSLTGIKDLDKLIVSYLPYKDIINFCKTCKYANKVICDEDFFRNLIYDKYRNTVKYKNYVKKNTWKSYFYIITNYISKLKSEYKFKYLSKFKNKEGSPELEYLSRNFYLGSKNKALKEACEHGHLPVVKYLLEMGADIHFKNDFCLFLAIKFKHISVVEFLIEKGSNIHLDSLKQSIASGNLNLVKYLTNLGCIMNDGDDVVLASEHGHLDILQYLIEIGKDISVHNCQALVGASMNGHLEIVKYIFEKVNNIDYNGLTRSFILACMSSHLEIVKYLLERGADIYLNQAFQVVCRCGYLDMVKYLKEYGVDIHYKEEKALRSACKYDRLSVVEFLTEHGADIHAKYNYSLKIAIEKRNLEIVEYLKRHGAELSISCI